jgi:hypothetical protein
MFERFLERYSPVAVAPDWQRPEIRWQWPHGTVRGFTDLMDEFSGRSFNNGLYRLHGQESGAVADRLVAEAFPENAMNAYCFGYDWLGCQYALDSDRRDEGEPLILLLDPATGEAFEIDCTFVAFHDVELVDSPNDSLNPGLFERWARENRRSLPLSRDVCVGYSVPLFLGGNNMLLENCEITDIEVYWRLNAQLRRAVRGLPNGVPINSLRI